MKSSAMDSLHEQRKYVVELHRQDHAIMQIVKLSGLSYPTVRNTIDLFEAGGIDAIQPRPRGRRPGVGRSLTAEQEQAIQHILRTQSPKERDLNHASWSRPAVAQLIEREYGISLSARGVGNYLRRWDLAPTGVADQSVTMPEPVQTDSAAQPNWGPQIRRQGVASQTLAGQTVQRLRRDIITHQFQPGERLTFEKLSRYYQVGSSPLREALFQVTGEGLVLAEEHKGFVVAPINVAEMLDISSLRAQFEAQAMRLSIPRGDNDWEARVLSANHFLKKATAQVLSASKDNYKEAAEEWEKRHRQLHTSLCSACGSPWLLHFIDILYEHLERYRRYFWDYSVRAAGADQEHEQIVQAALARDADQVVSLLQAHFQTQAELSLSHQPKPAV
ncbi:FCD domain-containing protein [Alcaligenaceae bacterium CGII-47]|nr:FCD domain-containing protein [Alcaligenaceae bacterium CGII-47]